MTRALIPRLQEKKKGSTAKLPDLPQDTTQVYAAQYQAECFRGANGLRYCCEKNSEQLPNKEKKQELACWTIDENTGKKLPLSVEEFHRAKDNIFGSERNFPPLLSPKEED